MADGDNYDGPFYGRGGERRGAVNVCDRRRRRLRFSETISEPCGEARQPPRVQTESEAGVLFPIAGGPSAGSVGAGRETQGGTTNRPRFRLVCSGSDRHPESVAEGEDAGVAGDVGGVCGNGEDDDLHDDVSASSAAVVKVKRLRTSRFAAMEEGSGSGMGTQASSRGTRGTGRRQRGADTTWLLTCGAPGGPEDPSVIPSFGGHIACRLWLDATDDRPVLVGYQRQNKLRE
ncbi:hypothetical protein RND81_05G028800 [Saponaria officinalis]|uniref:Uncharacterized protein n=1 Tax=Saponaria officinalis TaxID=3572 RepID=A0AAW1KTQ6_SAPOF